MFTVTIVGRPNVGKSSLYNCLTRTNHALVHDIAGVTRDRRYGIAQLGELSFYLIDTPGLEENKDHSLAFHMMTQTQAAIEDADLCLFVTDGKDGITPVDQAFAKWLRRFSKPVIHVINKCESTKQSHAIHEASRLGFDSRVDISTAHRQGIELLHESIEQYITKQEETEGTDNKPKAIHIAIIGRPNTGKSTYINTLLDQDRLLTGPEAGVTRDAIGIDWQWQDQPIRLIDTAGMRRKSHISQPLEKLSVNSSIRALAFAHIAIIVMDATQPFEKQDLHIIQHAIKEGRAIVLVCNKWDLIKNPQELHETLKHHVAKQLPDIQGVSIVPVSALNQQHIHNPIEAAIEAYTNWNHHTTTAKLNQWLALVTSKHLPPLGSNKRRVKLKYITQGNIRPPSFTLFVNRPQDLPQSYRRYIVNQLRQDFGLHATPIRLMVRKSDNPYKN